MRFHATVELNGKTATGISVPEEVLAGLDAGKRPAVVVTINGYSYRSTVGVMGGTCKLPLSAEHRAGAGVGAGDEVEVEIEVDTQPREVVLPADLLKALSRDPQAGETYARLSYSNQQRVVLPVQEAKTAETRERRIVKAIDALRLGRVP